MQLSGQLCRRSPCKAPLQGPHAPLLCLDLSDSLNEALAAEPLPGRRVGSGQPRSALRSRLPSNRHPRTTHGPAKPFWPRTAPLPAQAPPPRRLLGGKESPAGYSPSDGKETEPWRSPGKDERHPLPSTPASFPWRQKAVSSVAGQDEASGSFPAASLGSAGRRRTPAEGPGPPTPRCSYLFGSPGRSILRTF